MRSEKEIKTEKEASTQDIKISETKEDLEFNKGWRRALEWVLDENDVWDREKLYKAKNKHYEQED